MPSWLTTIFTIIGGLYVTIKTILLLFKHIPKLKAYKNRKYFEAARKTDNVSFRIAAIANDIETVVDNTIQSFKGELPRKWIGKAKIEWINEENLEKLAADETILRIRPIADQDKNLLNSIYYYFSSFVYPGIRSVLPHNSVESTSLHLARRAIRTSHPLLMNRFEQEYLEPAVHQEPNLVDYLGKYQSLDQRGYFTGIYIRELTDLAETNRFTEGRSRLPEEITGILNHLNNFETNVHKTMPEDYWYYETELSSYAIMLIAMTLDSEDTGRFIKRAKKWFYDGIEVLYLLGAEQERSFVKKVIKLIEKQTNYSVIEKIYLYRDYRGEPGGICVVCKSAYRISKDVKAAVIAADGNN